VLQLAPGCETVEIRSRKSMYYFKRGWQLTVWLGMNAGFALLWVFTRRFSHQNPISGQPTSWGLVVLMAACISNLVLFQLLRRQR